jgi:hypothetical protein
MRARFVTALHLILVVALIFGGFARVPVAALGAPAAALAADDCHSGKKHTHDRQAPDSRKSSKFDCCLGCCVPLAAHTGAMPKARERLMPGSVLVHFLDPRGPPHRPPRVAA